MSESAMPHPPAPPAPSEAERRRLDEALDAALEETFPASDPIAQQVPTCSLVRAPEDDARRRRRPRSSGN